MKASSDKAVHNGNVFVKNETVEECINTGYSLVYDSEGVFVGIYEYISAERKYKPYKMFL